jgi:hypothetical protein
LLPVIELLEGNNISSKGSVFKTHFGFETHFRKETHFVEKTIKELSQ